MVTLPSTSMFRDALTRVVPAMSLLAALGCSSPDAAEPDANAAFPADPMLTATSDAGRYLVEVRTAPNQPPERGVVAIDLRVLDATSQEPVEGLHVESTPWMPAMGHGTSVQPSVTPKADGRYVLTHVDLFMPGAWEIRTTLSGETVDHVAPSFQIH
jgi:hypothetical protein